MRSSSFLLASFIAVALAACGGSVSPSDDGTGSPSGESSTSGGSKSGKGSGSGSASSPSGGSNCHYDPVNNPVGCPPAYARSGLARCETIGLKCWYPGVGDGTGDGCWSTALLACVGADDETDSGADGGARTGFWQASQ